MSAFKILALGGDGIGPEILAAGLRAAEAAAGGVGVALDAEHVLLDGASRDARGTFCSEQVLVKARGADAMLVGAVGGTPWVEIRVLGGAEEQEGLMYLRQHLQTYLGLRPARSWETLLSRTPYGEAEFARFVRGGFELTRRRRSRVVSCDKSNDMESYKLWRTVVTEAAAPVFDRYGALQGRRPTSTEWESRTWSERFYPSR